MHFIQILFQQQNCTTIAMLQACEYWMDAVVLGQRRDLQANVEHFII